MRNWENKKAGTWNVACISLVLFTINFLIVLTRKRRTNVKVLSGRESGIMWSREGRWVVWREDGEVVNHGEGNRRRGGQISRGGGESECSREWGWHLAGFGCIFVLNKLEAPALRSTSRNFQSSITILAWRFSLSFCLSSVRESRSSMVSISVSISFSLNSGLHFGGFLLFLFFINASKIFLNFFSMNEKRIDLESKSESSLLHVDM